VTKNVPPGEIWVGNPAKPIRSKNMKVPFVDLSIQYQAHKKEIDQAVKAVLEKGVYVSGDFVAKI